MRRGTWFNAFAAEGGTLDLPAETRAVYNAKINIHREKAEPIFLGVRSEDLSVFETVKVESLSRDAEETGSFIVRP